MSTMVPIKEYKVAFWTGGKVLNSKMFDTEKEAKGFICSLPKTTVVTLMKLQNAGDGSYSWSVLDEGAGKFLPTMSWLYANRKPVGIGLGVFVLYKVLK
jgi:hypothetical protein